MEMGSHVEMMFSQNHLKDPQINNELVGDCPVYTTEKNGVVILLIKA